MCCSPLIVFLPLWWLSHWQLGAFTTSAARLAAMTVPRVPPKLRTPLLKLHAQTLRLNPHAGRRLPYSMHRPKLQLVKPD
jgi:hypothetical protein